MGAAAERFRVGVMRQPFLAVPEQERGMAKADEFFLTASTGVPPPSPKSLSDWSRNGPTSFYPIITHQMVS